MTVTNRLPPIRGHGRCHEAIGSHQLCQHARSVPSMIASWTGMNDSPALTTLRVIGITSTDTRTYLPHLLVHAVTNRCCKCTRLLLDSAETQSSAKCQPRVHWLH